MKCVPVPSRRQLVKAYDILHWAKGEDTPKPGDLVLWAHWSRLDARLAEILVHFFVRSFREISPTAIWEENQRSPVPASLAVLVEFSLVDARCVLLPADFFSYEAWAKMVLWKIPRADMQLFFLPEGTPSFPRNQRIMEHCLRPYLRWGFLGDESLVSKKVILDRTFLSPKRRQEILLKLMRSLPIFTVEDYMAACQSQVSRRTAERDLRASEALVKSGRTRSTKYRAKKSA